jgi:hypothetical protein
MAIAFCCSRLRGRRIDAAQKIWLAARSAAELFCGFPNHPRRKNGAYRDRFHQIFFRLGRNLLGNSVVCSGRGDRASMEDKMKDWTNARLCDVANLILGAFLFFSPWIFGFGDSTAAENANIVGVVIAVLAVAALAAFAIWEEWLNLIVGLWALVSPWVLGFNETTKAMTVCVVVGVLVAILAAVEIWMTSQTPPRLTANR